MNSFLYRILILSVLTVPISLMAGELSPAEQLAEQLKPMNSLNATFEQVIRDGEGAVLQQASGTLTVKRPRRFYWRTEQPYEHLVVTDGNILWLYDIDLEQITRQVFTADLDKAPALLLSGEVDEINRQYTIAVENESISRRHYRLTPKTPDALFKVLKITFSQSVLSHMELQDGFEQKTTIVFTDVMLNPLINDDIFQFTPPDGIDVITDEP